MQCLHPERVSESHGRTDLAKAGGTKACKGGGTCVWRVPGLPVGQFANRFQMTRGKENKKITNFKFPN